MIELRPRDRDVRRRRRAGALRRRPAHPRGRDGAGDGAHRQRASPRCCAPSTAWCRTSPAAPWRGRVVVDGRDTATHRPRDLADVVGFVGQDPLAGFVTDNVEDELAYGMESLGLAPAAMRKRVEETLDLLGLADLRGRPLRPAVRRPAAAGRDRVGADHPPAGAGARRADLGAGPAGRRGRAGHPAAAGPRPRPDRGARRAPPRAGRPVRRPGRARAGRRRCRSSPATRPTSSPARRSRRPWSSWAARRAGHRCPSPCGTPGGGPWTCAARLARRTASGAPGAPLGAEVAVDPRPGRRLPAPAGAQRRHAGGPRPARSSR